jgi:hypothetical protein
MRTNADLDQTHGFLSLQICGFATCGLGRQGICGVVICGLNITYLWGICDLRTGTPQKIGGFAIVE